MSRTKCRNRCGGRLSAVVCLGVGLLASPAVLAEPRPTRTDRDKLPKPVLRVAQEVADVGTPRVAEAALDKAESSHPLDPALTLAHASMATIKATLKDYTGSMMKRERIDGKLIEEIMFVKIRNEPFSVYMFFLSPSSKKGQEVIYEAGKNNGNLLAHGVGWKKVVGMVSLDPKSDRAMEDSRYPITEIGISNLCSKLIEQASEDRKHGECEVTIKKGAKVNGRPCTCITVMHPTKRDYFKFTRAEVFLDDEWNIPIRYAAYEWPTAPGGKPVLLEEYVYYNLKLNAGLTGADFDHNNKAYKFH